MTAHRTSHWHGLGPDAELAPGTVEDCAECGQGGTAAGCRHTELPDTLWRRLREAEDRAERRLELLRTVVSYDSVNQSNLPLPLLTALRAEVGAPL